MTNRISYISSPIQYLIQLEQKLFDKIKHTKKLGRLSKNFQLLSFPYFLDNGLGQLTLASYGSYYFYL